MGTKEDVVLVRNLSGEDCINYVLMYNMLTGIRIDMCFTFICHFHILTEIAGLTVSAQNKMPSDRWGLHCMSQILFNMYVHPSLSQTPIF